MVYEDGDLTSRLTRYARPPEVSTTACKPASSVKSAAIGRKMMPLQNDNRIG
jgi:hypothetical protein